MSEEKGSKVGGLVEEVIEGGRRAVGAVIEDAAVFLSESMKKPEDELGQMEAYRKYYPNVEEQEYIVSGSIVGCSCGTAMSKIELFEDHAVYDPNGSPVMVCSDCKPGINIHGFGTCKSLKKVGNADKSCTMALTGEWKEVGDEHTQIWSVSDGNYKPVLTKNGFLVCIDGFGLITIRENNNTNVADEGSGSNNWLNNLINDTSLGLSKSKKEAMLAAADVLINQGYELAFITGVLGNIKNEGTIGMFESSSYTSNPSAEPDYLQYMDNNYNYRNDYSGQSIVGKSLSTVYNMILQLEPNSWRDSVTNSRRGFGLGSVQWTFGRTKTLVEVYMEVANGSDTITLDQAAQAEGMMIARELAGSYNKIYTDWLQANQGNLNSSMAAYNAGYDVCMHYEIPADATTKAPVRATDAQTIFNVMK